MTVPLLQAEQRWECPNCALTEVTYGLNPNRYHTCRGLKGLYAPMVRAGTRCKVEAIEREDMLNGDEQRRDGEGRVIMAVETTRDDGTDRAVYCPPATARFG